MNNHLISCVKDDKYVFKKAKTSLHYKQICIYRLFRNKSDEYTHLKPFFGRKVYLKPYVKKSVFNNKIIKLT